MSALPTSSPPSMAPSGTRRDLPPPADMAPAEFSRLAARIEAEIRKVMVGQDELIRDVLAGVFTQGHLLLEGAPGLGKTVLLRTLGQALSLDFTRVQCTPDLMPADIVGTNVLVQPDADDRLRAEDSSSATDGGAPTSPGGGMSLEFAPGPVFTQLLLADEINRATPKTQSALLEAMAEASVTVGGVTRELPSPFFVMATQNPIEMEGTYPLPEAQLDRFLAKVLVPLPSADDLVEILARTTGNQHVTVEPVATAEELLEAIHLVREVPIASHVTRHVVDLVQATHPDDASAPDLVRRHVTTGASPRGAQSLILLAKVRALLDGRLQASIDDVRRAAPSALRHRLVLGYEALPAGVRPDDVVAAVIDAVPTPGPGS